MAARSASLSSPATEVQIGVSTHPGETAFTRIGASSTASA
jgi:hypothetical protein